MAVWVFARGVGVPWVGLHRSWGCAAGHLGGRPWGYDFDMGRLGGFVSCVFGVYGAFGGVFQGVFYPFGADSSSPLCCLSCRHCVLLLCFHGVPSVGVGITSKS